VPAPVPLLVELVLVLVAERLEELILFLRFPLVSVALKMRKSKFPMMDVISVQLTQRWRRAMSNGLTQRKDMASLLPTMAEKMCLFINLSFMLKAFVAWRMVSKRSTFLRSRVTSTWQTMSARLEVLSLTPATCEISRVAAEMVRLIVSGMAPLVVVAAVMTTMAHSLVGPSWDQTDLVWIAPLLEQGVQ